MQSISGRTYTKQKVIGSGSFSIVYLVIRDDGQEFAFKQYTRDTEDIDLNTLREISILRLFQNNKHGIINLEDIILPNTELNINSNTNNSIGIIMKRYKVDLHDAIRNKLICKKDRLKIAQQIIESICVLHENGVIHRDIKLQNILLDYNNNTVISDFSLAKILRGPCRSGTHTGTIGTVTYRAPEVVLNKLYSFSADVWSIGVVLYELFTGTILRSESDEKTLDFLSNKIKLFNDNSIGRLVNGLLRFDPNERWTLRQALESSMFNVVDFQVPLYFNILSSCKVSNAVKEMCNHMQVKKKVTMIAAQTYINTTQCSLTNAVELACKFYETNLYNYIDDNYPEEELDIFIKMNYSLYISSLK